MLLLVKLNRWWPSPLAQTGWREKERTRTDAACLMDVYIKPLLFLWRCVVSGHAWAIQNAETSLEHGSTRVYRREATGTNAANRYRDTMLLSNTCQHPEKME